MNLFSWSVFVMVVAFCCFQRGQGLPVGNPETVLENMAQIPQWHCMRYRKFELVRRCRGYKHSLRRL